MENQYHLDSSKIVIVNIKRDISPLFYKIYTTFLESRITRNDFEQRNLKIMSNLSNYTIKNKNNMLLYKNLSFENIFKRKNWEASKLYLKYLLLTTGSELIPIGNILLPFFINLRFISELHRIYFDVPLFGKGFFNKLRTLRNNNESSIKKILKKLFLRAGLRFLAKLCTSFGKKTTVKIVCHFLDIIPGIGSLISLIIGGGLDIPTLIISYKESKTEFLGRLMRKPQSCIRNIVQHYNDAINFFGRRADIYINNDIFNIQNIENNINFIDDINALLINPEEDYNI